MPYRIHTILTDNGVLFSDWGKPRRHRRSPSSTGSVANIASSTGSPSPTAMDQRSGRAHSPHARRGHLESLLPETYRQLRSHVADYLAAYNFAKRLKALRWKMPYETTRMLYESKSVFFRYSSDHLILGPNT